MTLRTSAADAAWNDGAMVRFEPGGRRLVVRVSGGLAILDTQSERASTAAIGELGDFVVFGDEIWAASRGRLERFDAAGAPCGAGVELPGDGAFTAAAGGARSAVYAGAGGAVLLRAEGGELSCAPISPAPSLALPLGAHRWLLVRGGALIERTPTGERRLETCFGAARVLAGGALCGGRIAAFVLDDGGAQAVVMIDGASGRVEHRLAVDGVTAARFVERRGHVLLRQGDRTLVVIEARFGRVLRVIEEESAIDDFAVDAEASRVALYSAATQRVRQLAYREFLNPGLRACEPAAERGSRADEPRDNQPRNNQPRNNERRDNNEPRAGEPRNNEPRDGEGPATSAIARAAAIVPARAQSRPRPSTPAKPLAPPPPDAPLLALEPRAPIAADRAQALAHLDAQIDDVAAWCARAIAEGWDSGRIGYASESALPFEAEVAALVGAGAGGRARAQLAAARERAAAHARPPAAGSPLELLGREFALSAVACDVLRVVLAPSVRGELARLYGILSNDPERPLCDELLVTQLLGEERASRHDVARELDDAAPLVRHGLVRAGAGARPFAALTCDPVLIDELRADAPARAPVPDLDELWLPDSLRAAILDELARPPSAPLRLVLAGRPGSGRRSLAAALASRAGRRLALIDAALLSGAERPLAPALALELRRASLRGELPCVANLDRAGLDEPGARDAVREVLRRHPKPLAVRCAPDEAPPLDAGHARFELPSLSESERADCFRRALSRRALPLAAADGLAARYRVEPGVIEHVTAQAARACGDDPAGALDAALRQYRDTRIGAVATRVARLADWSQAVLPPEVVDSIREFIGRVERRRTVFEEWGFSRVLSSARGLVALFQGGPGTGKSMVAGIIARELGFDLYRIDLSRILSKWIGETEQNLAQVFDAAEDGQAILLFDEADSLFAKRTEVKTSSDRYANAEVNYLLQRLDSFEGIAILTSNFGASIDAAFKRRLSLRLQFPFPDEEQREQLWRVHLPPELPVEGELDLAGLARRYPLSGGYVRNIALRAAFLAAQEGTALTQQHLERAVKLEYRDVGTLVEGGVLE
ncbi:MAG TPA: ATP-binding protein [Polyangia bacterium]|nr:ATP-binding protein [Polyangia bacterium]